MPRAGQKRHRISIQRRLDEKDAFNEGIPSWTDIVTRYSARVRDDSQREFTANLQVQDDKTVHIEIRDPRKGVKVKDRVIWHAETGDRIYDLKAVLGAENTGRDLTLICVEHS